MTLWYISMMWPVSKMILEACEGHISGWKDSCFLSIWQKLQNLSYGWWFLFKRTPVPEEVERWSYNPRVLLLFKLCICTNVTFQMIKPLSFFTNPRNYQGLLFLSFLFGICFFNTDKIQKRYIFTQHFNSDKKRTNYFLKHTQKYKQYM